MKFNPECGGEGQFEQGDEWKWNGLSLKKKLEMLGNRSGSNPLFRATHEILNKILKILSEQPKNPPSSLQDRVKELAEKLEKGE